MPTLIFEVNDRDARAAFDGLQRELRETARDARHTNRHLRDTRGRFIAAGQGVDTFTKALGSARGLLTGLGVGVAGKELLAFGAAAVRAAGQMEGVLRALAAIEGETATQRLREFNEIAPATPANAGTEAYVERETQLFERGRQQLQAQHQLAAAHALVINRFTAERIAAAQAARAAEVEGFSAAAAAGKSYETALRQLTDSVNAYSAPAERIGAVHIRTFESVTARISTADAALQAFLQHRMDAAGHRVPPATVPPRIPRVPIPPPADTTAPDAGAARLEQLAEEARAVQESLREQERYYRQFANSVSNLFTGVVTGRIQGVEAVASQFIAHSLRIVARAYIEYEIQKRLDDQLTASKLANLQRVAAAQHAGGVGGAAGSGIGNLIGGLPGFGNIGSALSGGAAALGVSALLFPQESNNLLQGIKDEIGGFIASVADAPDKAFGAKQQVFLRIGDNEVRDITYMQEELREEDRV